MKGQSLLFWKHLQQSSSFALPHCCKFGWFSRGFVDETVTEASRPEAVVWALLLGNSYIHHPCLKRYNKKEKNNKDDDLISTAFIIN